MATTVGMRVRDPQIVITDHSGDKLELNLHTIRNGTKVRGGFAWAESSDDSVTQGTAISIDDLRNLRDFLNNFLD
jgi:hypothetical protein